MVFDVHYDDEHDCLIGSYSGEMSLEAVDEYAAAVSAESARHTCKLFMNDMRNAKLAFSATEIYRLPGILDAAGFDRTWKRAVVALDYLPDYRFFETVARNRGYQVRIFQNVDEAIDWLTKGKQTERPADFSLGLLKHLIHIVSMH